MANATSRCMFFWAPGTRQTKPAHGNFNCMLRTVACSCSTGCPQDFPSRPWFNRTTFTGSGRVVSESGISLENGVGFGIWLLLGSWIRRNWARDAGYWYEKKAGCGILTKKERECGIKTPLPPFTPPTPTPFLQTLRLVTVLFYRINDTKLDVGIEIQELTQTNSDTQYKEKANCDI